MMKGALYSVKPDYNFFLQGFDGTVSLLPGLWNDTFAIVTVLDGMDAMVYVTLLNPMLESRNYTIEVKNCIFFLFYNQYFLLRWQKLMNLSCK